MPDPTDQLALIDAEQLEELAVLMPDVDVRKRYTAAQAEKIEWRRDSALYMLGRRCPVTDIARVLRMNVRTVEALAAQHGPAVARFSDEYAAQLLASAAGDIALADTKKHEANYLQLNTGAKLKTDMALNLKLTVAGQGDLEEKTIDIETDNPALVAARKFLAERCEPAK